MFLAQGEIMLNLKSKERLGIVCILRRRTQQLHSFYNERCVFTARYFLDLGL